MQNNTTYQPQGIEELQQLLQQAQEHQLSVLTRRQKQDGVQIDFQHWNNIREIDTINLTVTAERGVTVGELEAAVQPYGLHMAAMTDDLKHITLGDFFAEQYTCLTSNRYNQPRYQILGLEVILTDGTLLQVAGKTVKNVTGYDMCRFYISNRETLAIPLAFTIKLVSKQPVQAMLEAPIKDTAVLMDLVRQIREKQLRPEVCLYWSGLAAQQLGGEDADGRLVIVLSGSAERLQRDLWEISKIAETLQIDLTLCEQPETIWNAVEQLRSAAVWHDGVKVPALKCDAMLKELDRQRIGCWYSLLQGSLQLMPQKADAVLYRELCQHAEALGGCGNWYYQYVYGFASTGETMVWQQLKDKFDADHRLNPIKNSLNHNQKGGM